jgi:hypothetical protein
VTLNGGTINLVDGSIDTLSLGDGLTLTAGQLALEIGPNGTSDLIDVTNGTVSATGSITVNIAGLSGFGTGTYNLITGSSSGLNNLVLGTTPGGAFSYSLVSGSNGEQLVVAATPEPASLGLLGVAAGAILLLRRRKSAALH